MNNMKFHILKDRESATKAFNALDANGDGYLTKDEFL